MLECASHGQTKLSRSNKTVTAAKCFKKGEFKLTCLKFPITEQLEFDDPPQENGLVHTVVITPS